MKMREVLLALLAVAVLGAIYGVAVVALFKAGTP